jgi:hypothetical protein
MAHVAQDGPADDTDDQYAEQHTHQPHIQAHVSIQKVAELVGDNTLQFVATEGFQAAARDGDGGIARCETGCKGVETLLLFENIDFGHRHTGGDRHFFHHIVQSPAQRVLGVGCHPGAAQSARDLAAAGAETGDTKQAGQTDKSYRPQAGQSEQTDIVTDPRQTRCSCLPAFGAQVGNER